MVLKSYLTFNYNPSPKKKIASLTTSFSTKVLCIKLQISFISKIINFIKKFRFMQLFVNA